MRLEKDTAILVRAIRPNAKAIRAGFACRDGAWTIRDGDEIISITYQGRRAAWVKALSKLRNQQTTGE